MIINSNTRKDISFRQLVGYIYEEHLHRADGEEIEEEKRDERDFILLHNFQDYGVDLENTEEIANAFLENDKQRRRRKNGVTMYHEIASFAPEDQDKMTRSMLYDMARKYIELRAKNGLVLARPHFDKDHVHIHFMISGNEQGNNRSMRVSKEQFKGQRRAMEEYQLSNYPQLSKSYVQSRDGVQKKQKYNRTKQEKVKRQMEKRTAKFSIFALILEEFEAAISKAHNLKTLVKEIKGKGYQVYERRGQATGIVVNNKKYRFTTLAAKTKYNKKMELILSNKKVALETERRIEKDLADLRRLREKREREQERNRKNNNGRKR
ncbi:relaxase/mobilization nuclease domain-containing protein [Bernardetia sp.]|uniref:relaxase/mobilization nuclease domain-containing protein n=1 Tax=Bernardetia sp. TaxID=1937974 RepID=UPI0025C5921D|nr:relaxase/mobilization nuclease domain-containing protein [Bernardetia sp.]